MDQDPIYNRGDEVEVIFFVDSPEDAIINSAKEKYKANSLLALVGLSICIGSMAYYYLKIKSY